MEISTTNYAITVQLFDNTLPKIFCKEKEHSVLKADYTLFEIIKSCTEWDDPNYGYRTRFNYEVDDAKSQYKMQFKEIYLCPLREDLCESTH